MFFEIHLEENNEIFVNQISAKYKANIFTEVNLQDFPV